MVYMKETILHGGNILQRQDPKDTHESSIDQLNLQRT